MKALILAAGLGTRLRPHTRRTPKPLFTLNGRPLLDIAIRRLIEAGADAIAVNTHHLHPAIEAFLRQISYPVPVIIRHEPKILGTGGAIRNLSDFWDDHAFWVVNSDIVTDVDLKALAGYHQSHPHPATLALVDDPAFNTVAVDAGNRVIGFDPAAGRTAVDPTRWLTFTGIQVLDPAVLDYLPAEGASSSIDAFRSMINDGVDICAWIPKDAYWSDLGTPERYGREARSAMVAAHLQNAGTTVSASEIRWEALAGDGSDRRWIRATSPVESLVLADHGIRPRDGITEADAFVAIGRHLASRGLPVPAIHAADLFSGLVLMEDLGDTSLEERVRSAASSEAVADVYRDAVNLLIRMSIDGAIGFDTAWTWQTAFYDRKVIIENECRYFMDAFVAGRLEMAFSFDELEGDFQRLADMILAPGLSGFMHRDFQSRNIMVTDGRLRIIDFQGGRLGPPTYDLASLLIDPYTDIGEDLRGTLVDRFVVDYSAESGVERGLLRSHYLLCSLARNLQMLGAFGFLTRIKGKPWFERSIPVALNTLKRHPLLVDDRRFPTLSRLVDRLPG
jgi:aminoglycoside/choline kinase family phosphotransferase